MVLDPYGVPPMAIVPLEDLLKGLVDPPCVSFNALTWQLVSLTLKLARAIHG